MRFLNVSSVLSIVAVALLSFSETMVRADGWMAQGPVVYRSYYAAPATYNQACQQVYAHSMYYAPQAYLPRTTAPQSYSQQSYGYSQSRVPAYAPPRPTTTATVGAFDNYFEPKTINVQPGTTVRWVNRGRHAHTVTADDDRWDSGDIAPGASYTATFQRPGTYYYFCRHHADEKMRGTIVVGSQSGYGANAREAAGIPAGQGDGGGGDSPVNGRRGRTNGAGRSGY